MLCGFTVQQRSSIGSGHAMAALQDELRLADVSVNTWPGFGASRDLHDAILIMLLELVDAQPEAVELLAGRTFARTLH
jgi:hypothetical protein